MQDPLGKATTSLEDKRRANSASTGLSVLVFYDAGTHAAIPRARRVPSFLAGAEKCG